MLVTVGAVGSVVLLLCLLCACLFSRHASRRAAACRKQHAFGIKKAGYAVKASVPMFRHPLRPFLEPRKSNCFLSTQQDRRPSRNPPPVTNPDRGAKYLKKSPSPTGVKSPPGGSTAMIPGTAEEFLQKKATLTCTQQVWYINILQISIAHTH